MTERVRTATPMPCQVGDSDVHAFRDGVLVNLSCRVFFVLCAAAAMTLPALRQSIPWTPYAPNSQAAQYRMPPKDAVGIP